MKKIGIITIIDYMNYGNRLQNYATQEVLRSLGCTVETIINFPQDKNIRVSIFEKVRRANLKTYISFVAKIRFKVYKTRKEVEIQKIKQLRNSSFIEFTKNNIKESNFVITPNTLPLDLGEKFDYFVVGSDQVWNPNFRAGSPIDFITFAHQSKRIAFAPSFGVSEIPLEYKKNYAKWLSEFEHLSVREQAGANIIKELTGKEAIILLDPTLMLSNEQWINISKPAKYKPKCEFLLTYFLGEVSEETKRVIDKISRENDLEVIELGNYRDNKRYNADPSEFIDYIKSSYIFLTDSFHGAVFSIIFEKQFIVFDRIGSEASMTSRIDTLLTKFELLNRKWEAVKTSKKYFGEDFSHISIILDHERHKSYNYLYNALEIEGGN